MRVNKETIKRILDKQHMPNVIQQQFNDDMPILEGKLCFDTLPSDIQIHCCDVIEKQHAFSSAEIKPCVSINILLEGKVSFKLGNRPFQFMAHEKKPISFINVVSKNEIFTRTLVANQTVKKVNLRVDKQWLLNRSPSIQESEKIEQLFNQGTMVYQPQILQILPDLAKDLMLNWSIKKLDNQIISEQLALKIIGLCIPALLKEQKPSVKSESKQPIITSKEQSFFNQFDALAIQNLSLKETAQALGVSVSTLQRRIKLKYQVTAIEYIRHKKLHEAKRSLIIDGLSIGEIAFNAGYNHTSNFVIAFKKRFNITPTEFRRCHANW